MARLAQKFKCAGCGQEAKIVWAGKRILGTPTKLGSSNWYEDHEGDTYCPKCWEDQKDYEEYLNQ